ncbi:hypothetical protein NBRC3188_0273 [Acetobacter pasteurianus NBRC 3188]|uniref:Uncharacterized protein n=1 Tax=Acetobacter pasteurianus NBRC 3188 TaxID=1226663 RepID=A0A401WQJ7_ACEPA|nr:hypothetical protein NBRC3188_0273 [Acetobacter pasteurianus NBRC 3188]
MTEFYKMTRNCLKCEKSAWRTLHVLADIHARSLTMCGIHSLPCRRRYKHVVWPNGWNRMPMKSRAGDHIHITLLHSQFPHRVFNTCPNTLIKHNGLRYHVGIRKSFKLRCRRWLVRTGGHVPSAIAGFFVILISAAIWPAGICIKSARTHQAFCKAHIIGLQMLRRPQRCVRDR